MLQSRGTWAVGERLRFHLIGHLQSNKAARAAELFDGIDSLDSVRLAERLNEAAGKYGKAPAGADRSEAQLRRKPNRGWIRSRTRRLSCWSGCPICSNLEVRGLMTIAPWGAADDVTRACFRSLRQWRERWAGVHPNLNFDVLSMGMSGDFALAIGEGATRIRIGTALFGKRSPQTEPRSKEMEID